ncbi:MAG TPA: hypothetical protein VKA95_12520 [Nitrososphaeraceae archaeon]|jgi:hypothetical protein|nr:hypothetical protein [Nitrososphaeraceae archaeon]
MDNTQMGFIPFELDWTMDDEIIEIMMIDMNTGESLVHSFDMSESIVVAMEWRNSTIIVD